MYTTTRTDLKRRSNEFRRPPCDRRPHRPHQGVEDARLSPGPSLPAPFQSVLSFQHDDPSPNSATVDRFCRFCRRVFTSQERSRVCCFGSGFSLPACCWRVFFGPLPVSPDSPSPPPERRSVVWLPRSARPLFSLHRVIFTKLRRLRLLLYSLPFLCLVKEPSPP